MLLVLLACGERPEKPDSADTAADSAGPDSATDSSGESDSGTGGDTAAAPPFFAAAPDFSLEPCGTDETIGDAVDAGADIDGDGLADALVDAPENDEHGTNQGAVYVFLGSAAGALGPDDAWATLYGDAPHLTGAWYDDLDGDGLPEVVAGDWFFPGARVLAGGDLTVADALVGWAPVGVPYADIDGDGVREVLVPALDSGGHVTLLDGAAALTGGPDTELGELRGGENSWTGSPLLLVGDRDGDGFPEVVSRVGSDLVVFGSSSLLGGGQTELQRVGGLGYCDCSIFEGTWLVTDDFDGDGLEDLVAGVGEVYAVGSAAGNVDESALPRLGLAASESAEPAAWGPDLDGDAAGELWARVTDPTAGTSRYVAVGGAALAAGTASAASPAAAVASPSLGGYADLSVGADGRVWLGDRVEYHGPGQVQVFAPAPGDDLDASDALATITGAPYGHPEWAFDQGLAQTVWTDLDGDGTTELVVEWQTEGHIFDTAQLATGGTLSICDASASWTYTGERELDDVQLPGDLDGDGLDDVLFWSRPWGEASSVELVSGAAFLVDPGARGREVFGEDGSWRWRYAPVADLDGDGLREWLAGIGGTTGDILVRGSAWAGTVGAADLLGPVTDGSDELSVLADLDGDGLVEVGTVLPGRPAYFVVFSGADVLGGGALDATAALVRVDGDEEAVRGAAVVDDLDGDGIPEVAVGTWNDTRGVTYVFGGAELAAGGTLALGDALRTVAGRDPTRWPDVDGDGVAELLTWSRGEASATLGLYLGAELAVGDLTAADAAWSYTFADPDAALLHAGPGLPGAGPALTVHWTEPDTYRDRVSVFFGG